MSDLSGKVALVTGGSRGIGRAIALALARSGIQTAINFRSDKQSAVSVCREIEEFGGVAICVRGDVSQPEEVDLVVAQVNATFGDISILVNNAGFAQPASLDNITKADWDRTIQVNLDSAFLVTQAVFRQMQRQSWGRIINMSSIAAQTGGIVGVHYATSKAGIIGMTNYYAANLYKYGITANSIAAAFIRTDMMLKHLNLPGNATDNFGDPEQVASVALMLCNNSFINGQTINVNGGRYFS
jgi:3-oxoacyl-[acyl-carrier protein] reductase